MLSFDEEEIVIPLGWKKRQSEYGHFFTLEDEKMKDFLVRGPLFSV